MGISEMANRLNTGGTAPPQGARWTKHTIYNLRLWLSQIQRRAVNVRPHTDEDVKERIPELRARTRMRRLRRSLTAGISAAEGVVDSPSAAFANCSVAAADRTSFHRADSWKRCWIGCSASMKRMATTNPSRDLDSRRWRSYSAMRAT